MSGEVTLRPNVRKLDKRHDRDNFSCGVEALDTYFKKQARQEATKRVASVFVLSLSSGEVIGFYTLNPASFSVGELPADLAKKYPRYDKLPATLLGRLAVDARFRRQKWGYFLLIDALRRVLLSDFSGIAVQVDAKDDAAKNFYERFGFESFENHTHKLFITMPTVADLLRSEGIAD